MFNPQTPDRSADYIFEGLQQAQKYADAERMRRQQQMQQGLQALGSAFDTWHQQAQKNAAIDGGVAALASVGKQNPDLVGGQEFLTQLLSEKNKDKQAGMLALGMKNFQQNQEQAMAMDRLGAEFNNRMALQNDQQAFLAEQEAAAAKSDRTGQTTTVTDPVTGQKVGLYFQNNKQVAKIEPGGGADTKLRVVPTKDGMATFNPATGALELLTDAQGNPVQPPVRGSGAIDPEAAARQAEIGRLTSQIADYSGKVAAGKGNSSTSWWNPWGQTYADGLREAEARRQALLTAPGAGAAGSAPAAAPADTTGYVVGKKYGGLTYLGGDPKLQTSWR